MNDSSIAIIALGSNLDQPIEKIKLALKTIAHHAGINILACSSLYLTKPVGYLDQPDFINAVCMVSTTLEADELLKTLHSIEAEFGRKRSFRNAPRTLDLDLIDYEHKSYQTPQLILPHPRATERSFVMLPLAEIAPDYRIGDADTAQALAQTLENEGIQRLNETLSFLS